MTSNLMKHNAHSYDKWILVSTVALVLFGLLMVSSASMVISDRHYGYPFHYLIRQSVYIAIGFIAAGFVLYIPLRTWQQYSGYLMLISLFLLFAVLIPGIGRSVNGSRRWFELGFFSLQVTEIVKLFAIIYIAHYLVRFNDQIREQWIGSLKPMLLLGVLALLLLLEPDFGTFVVITMTFLTLLFIAGIRLWPFLLLLGSAIVALSLLAVFSPYRLERLTTFIDPWAQQYGAGYQLTQSLIAFGRGGFFGVGLGNSVQKLFYLPEAHTDFIFAVIGEELGLMGELFVIALYSTLIGRIFYQARYAFKIGQDYLAYLAFGIGFWLSFQVMINIGVSIGVLPTKGLTLPFISYGGSSLIMNCVALAIALRISYEINSSELSIDPSHSFRANR